MNLIFLDTETTGTVTGKDKLCSIAYKVNGEMVHEYFKPDTPISIDAMAVHHITNEMVADKPSFEGSQTQKDIIKLLEDHVLVAHNAPFDVGVLEAEGIKVPQYICTYRVARGVDEEAAIPRYALQYLRYFLNLNVKDASAHDAAGDVKVLEALFGYLEPKMPLEKMLEISKQPILMRHFPFGKYKGQLIKDVAKTDRGYLNWLLGQKQQSITDGKNPADEADWIHTLKYYLT